MKGLIEDLGQITDSWARTFICRESAMSATPMRSGIVRFILRYEGTLQQW